MYKNVCLDDIRFCINEIRNCTSLDIWDVCTPESEIGAVVKEAHARVLNRVANLNDAAYIDDNLDTIQLEWALGNFLKKFRYAPPAFQRDREREAVEGFISRNSDCKGHRVSSNVRYVMRNLLSRWLPKPTPRTGPFRMGPGAVCDVQRATHFDKFSQLVSVGVLRSPFGGIGGLHNPWACGGLDTAPCRLCAVPKDYYRDRLITVEPTCLAFGQQEARFVIYQSIAEGPLRKRPINHLRFDDPTLFFRRKALEGSRDGSWGTIDLSNASDLISWEDVLDVFPSWMVAMLECVRSAQFTTSGVTRDMHMYAGMGNATTFVVESLFFRAMCHALIQMGGFRPSVQVETFGDDIIVSDIGEQGFADLYCGLADNGLIVNVDKSYTSHTTKFRESCGQIALAGHSLETFRFYGYRPEDLPSLCDLFARMGVSKCALIRGFAQRLMDSPIGASLARAGAVMVPDLSMNCDGACAIPSDCYVKRPDVPDAERRWSVPYQRWEYRLPVVTTESRPRRYSRAGMGSSLFDATKFWTYLYGVALPARDDDHVLVPGSTRRTRIRWRWRG